MHAWSARRALPRTFQGQRCAWSPSCCSRITMAHCERNTPRASGYQCFLAWLVAGSATPRCASMNFVVVEETHLCNRRLKKFSFRRKTVKRKEAGARSGARRSRRSLHDRSPDTFRFKNTGLGFFSIQEKVNFYTRYHYISLYIIIYHVAIIIYHCVSSSVS